MGALTGNTVQSTYLDLVQLGQSGAGLPSHAGKEAALYDGAGYQILGRTTLRDWMDPHPDNIAGSWEFSTYGNANQTALEAAGWEFTNCTGAVSGGVLWITKSSTDSLVFYATLTVNLTGDFDYVVTPIGDIGAYTAASPFGNTIGGFGVADCRAGVADVAHHVYILNSGGSSTVARYVSGQYTALAGTLESDNLYISGPLACRIWRYSSTVELNATSFGPTTAARIRVDDSAPQLYGWPTNAPVTDSSTFNKLFFTAASAAVTTTGTFGIASIRRFQ